MFFRQRLAANATLSYFFGCAGLHKAVAVDVVAGDEDWFIDEAAKAGVQIDLIVRGACMLPPGIEGVTDRIRVRSVSITSAKTPPRKTWS